MHFGFIGLGSMGSHMARNLLEHQGSLVVHDIDEDAMSALETRGAEAASTPAQLSERVDTICLSLPDDAAVRDVVFGDTGLLQAVEPGDILVDLTTSFPPTTKEVEKALNDRGAHMIGGGVTRGIQGAREGTLGIMVGGEEGLIEQCAPLFEAISTDVFHVGTRPDQGHAAKLLVNYLWSVGLIATCEAIALGKKVGLAPETMIETFNAGAGRNEVTEGTFPEYILTQGYDSEFSVGLWDKDLRLFSDFADRNDAPVLFGEMTRQMAGMIRATIGRDEDSTRSYEFFEKLILEEASGDKGM